VEIKKKRKNKKNKKKDSRHQIRGLLSTYVILE